MNHVEARIYAATRAIVADAGERIGNLAGADGNALALERRHRGAAPDVERIERALGASADLELAAAAASRERHPRCEVFAFQVVGDIAPSNAGQSELARD